MRPGRLTHLPPGTLDPDGLDPDPILMNFPTSARNSVYDEDYFKDSRMSFGDHLEELRSRMWKAFKGLILCMFLACALDFVGKGMGWQNFGIALPVFEFIKKPAEEQMHDFYSERAWQAKQEADPPADEAEKKRREKEDKPAFFKMMRDAGSKGTDVVELNKPQNVQIKIKKDDLRKALDGMEDEFASVEIQIQPVDWAVKTVAANAHIGNRHQLATMSVQEGIVVYFKVALLCGFTMASPWIFWQFWSFVGAGLYPKEKRYIHVYLPFSLVLFLIGITLCFAIVLPGAVKALLGFNEWLGLDPDIRLSEWLSLALLFPLIFGLSFQTPLVMLFLNRIGMFTWQAYYSKWRHATMILAVFAIVVTPTPDPVTWLFLFIPMMALYIGGILLCKMLPPPFSESDELENQEVAV